jgi:hypothetical protein
VKTWVESVFECTTLLTINHCPVLVGDNIKIPKEAQKMPGIKKLHPLQIVELYSYRFKVEVTFKSRPASFTFSGFNLRRFDSSAALHQNKAHCNFTIRFPGR